MQKLRLVRTGKVCEDAPRYTTPSQVYLECRGMIKLDREHFVALHLDGKNRMIAVETISIGSLNQAIVEPREVFKSAVYNNSAALIVVHNHPTGDPTPSPEDIMITNRLKEAGEIIGIRIIDHIIIGSSSFYSMAANGWRLVPNEIESAIASLRKKQSTVEKAKSRKKPAPRQRQAVTIQ